MPQTVKNLPEMQEIQVGPWVGKISGEENGYPLQYSCLENSVDRGAWWAAIYGVAQSHSDTPYFLVKVSTWKVELK